MVQGFGLLGVINFTNSYYGGLVFVTRVVLWGMFSGVLPGISAYSGGGCFFRRGTLPNYCTGFALACLL